jgi:hypothetical protein
MTAAAAACGDVRKEFRSCKRKIRIRLNRNVIIED